MRTVDPHLPERSGVTDGLAWNLFLPRHGEPVGGVLVLHGAGSRKERHHDFARAASTFGLAAMCLDVRGHGESSGPLDGRVVADVATAAGALREHLPGLPIALRGSSMGGYLALAGARAAGASAVCAICPAPAALLQAGLRAGRFDLDADVDAVCAALDEHSLVEATRSLAVPVILLHARGDESVPIASSRELAQAGPHVKLVEIPGGDHRSIQHDAELQGVSLRFLARALRHG